MENSFYSAQEVAKILKVSYMSVYRWIRAGKLKSFKAGKQYRINKGDLEKFLKQK